MLNSKLDQYPDEAWGWDSVLIRDPHQGEDPSQLSSSVPQPSGIGEEERQKKRVAPAGTG